MPFGKYKGENIGDIPTGYLTWLLEQDWASDPVVEMVREELIDRLGLCPPPHVGSSSPILVPPKLREHVDTILSAGFRAASHTAHPDHGGTDEQMRGILEARAWLSKNVR